MSKFKGFVLAISFFWLFIMACEAAKNMGSGEFSMPMMLINYFVIGIVFMEIEGRERR